jgi:hypothetical protein
MALQNAVSRLPGITSQKMEVSTEGKVSNTEVIRTRNKSEGRKLQ